MLHLDVKLLQTFVLSRQSSRFFKRFLLRGFEFVKLPKQYFSLFEEWFDFAAVFGPDIIKAVGQRTRK